MGHFAGELALTLDPDGWFVLSICVYTHQPREWVTHWTIEPHPYFSHGL